MKVSLGNKQLAQGFTLIELIMVVVILGVLAAFALPLFTNLSSDALKSRVQATAAGFQSGIHLARSTWRLAGEPPSFDFNGDVLVVSNEGWPRCGYSAPCSSGGAADHCVQVFRRVLDTDITVINNSICPSHSREYCVTGSGSLCTFTLKKDNSYQITYDNSTGKVTAITP